MNRHPHGFRRSITTTPISRPGESMRRSPARRVTPGIDSVGRASNACRAIFANTPEPPIPIMWRRNLTPIARHVIGLSPGNPHHCFPMTNGSPSVREVITVPAGGIPVPTATGTRPTTARLNASTAMNTTRRAPTTLIRGGVDTSTSARRATDAIRRDKRRDYGMIRSSLLAGMMFFVAISASDGGQMHPIRCRVTYCTSAQVYFDGGREEGLSIGDTMVIARGDSIVGSAVITAISSHSSVSRPFLSLLPPRVGDTGTLMKEGNLPPLPPAAGDSATVLPPFLLRYRLTSKGSPEKTCLPEGWHSSTTVNLPRTPGSTSANRHSTRT